MEEYMAAGPDAPGGAPLQEPERPRQRRRDSDSTERPAAPAAPQRTAYFVDHDQSRAYITRGLEVSDKIRDVTRTEELMELHASMSEYGILLLREMNRHGYDDDWVIESFKTLMAASNVVTGSTYMMARPAEESMRIASDIADALSLMDGVMHIYSGTRQCIHSTVSFNGVASSSTTVMTNILNQTKEWGEKEFEHVIVGAMLERSMRVVNDTVRIPEEKMVYGRMTRVGTLTQLTKADSMRAQNPRQDPTKFNAYEVVPMSVSDMIMMLLYSHPRLLSHQGEYRHSFTEHIAETLRHMPQFAPMGTAGRVTCLDPETRGLVLIDMSIGGGITRNYNLSQHGFVDVFKPSEGMGESEVCRVLGLENENDWFSGDIENAVRNHQWLAGTCSILSTQKAGIKSSLSGDVENIFAHDEAWGQFWWTLSVFISFAHMFVLNDGDGMCGSGTIMFLSLIGASRTGKTSLYNRIRALMDRHAIAPVGMARSTMTLFAEVMNGGRRLMEFGDIQCPIGPEILSAILQVADGALIPMEKKFVNPISAVPKIGVVFVGNVNASGEPQFNNRCINIHFGNPVEGSKRNTEIATLNGAEFMQFALAVMIRGAQMRHLYKARNDGRLEDFLDPYQTASEMTKRSVAGMSFYADYMSHLFSAGVVENSNDGSVMLSDLNTGVTTYARRYGFENTELQKIEKNYKDRILDYLKVIRHNPLAHIEGDRMVGLALCDGKQDSDIALKGQ